MRIGEDLVSVTIVDGALHFVDDAPLNDLRTLGTTSTRRLSHVEPDNAALRWFFHAIRCAGATATEWTRHWTCRWRVNMAPVSGPVLDLPKGATRLDALRAERQWLWNNRHI